MRLCRRAQRCGVLFGVFAATLTVSQLSAQTLRWQLRTGDRIPYVMVMKQRAATVVLEVHMTWTVTAAAAEEGSFADLILRVRQSSLTFNGRKLSLPSGSFPGLKFQMNNRGELKIPLETREYLEALPESTPEENASAALGRYVLELAPLFTSLPEDNADRSRPRRIILPFFDLPATVTDTLAADGGPGDGVFRLERKVSLPKTQQVQTRERRDPVTVEFRSRNSDSEPFSGEILFDNEKGRLQDSSMNQQMTVSVSLERGEDPKRLNLDTNIKFGIDTGAPDA